MTPIIDMHCDTIYKIYELRRQGENVGLRSNKLHVDLLRMKEAGYMAQCFALFTYMPYTQERGMDPAEYAKALSDTMDRELEANSDLIRPALTAGDIARNYREGFLSAIKTVEEGAIYKGSPEMVRFFYEHGVRKSTLTWNFENELAFPNRAVKNLETGEYRVFPETERGLKKAGQDVVQLMEELGMLIDVSHLGDAGILEILDLVDPHTPVIASHSNARTVAGHPRNLTDQMLRGIAEHGGVTGINFCAAFLTEDGNGVSRIHDMVRHVRYIYDVAGCDAIGLGTDFDGIDDQLEINGAGEMQRLADALSAAGFTSGEIEKIFWRNVMRVYAEVLG
jgi:membrane dipeptidase